MTDKTDKKAKGRQAGTKTLSKEELEKVSGGPIFIQYDGVDGSVKSRPGTGPSTLDPK